MTEQLLRRFVRDYEKVQDAQVRERYGMLSGGVGIFLNLLLSAGKFFAGVLTGSHLHHRRRLQQPLGRGLLGGDPGGLPSGRTEGR